MKKTVLLFVTALLLTACTSEVSTSDYTTIAQTDKDLKGCVIKHVSGGLHSIYIARCPNSTTTATWSSGKTRMTSVTIDEGEAQLQLVKDAALAKLTQEERDALGIK